MSFLSDGDGFGIWNDVIGRRGCVACIPRARDDNGVVDDSNVCECHADVLGGLKFTLKSNSLPEGVLTN